MEFLNSSAGAAWFQAIFTLIGLGIAIFVPWKQNRISSKRKEQSIEFETKCCLLTLKTVMERYLRLANEIDKSPKINRSKIVEFLPLTILSNEARILREIPIHKFHETDNVDYVLRTMTVIDYIIQTNIEIKDLINKPANTDSIRQLKVKAESLAEFIVDHKKTITEIEKGVDKRLQSDTNGVTLKKKCEPQNKTKTN